MDTTDLTVHLMSLEPRDICIDQGEKNDVASDEN